MADPLWLPSFSKFVSIQWSIENVSRSGGMSLLGSEQVVSSPSGRWKAALTLSVSAQAWNSPGEVLLLRGLLAKLRGRARTIAVPYVDFRTPAHLAGIFIERVPHSDGSGISDGSAYSQASVPVTLAASVAMNATLVTLLFPAGIQPLPGQCFTLPDGRMHQVADLIAFDGAAWMVEISPWLRADYAAGAAADFDKPNCPMRLAKDDSGALTITRDIFATPSIEFVEAF